MNSNIEQNSIVRLLRRVMQRRLLLLVLTAIIAAPAAFGQSANSGLQWQIKNADSISDSASDDKRFYIADYAGNAVFVNKQTGRIEFQTKARKDSQFSIALADRAVLLADDAELRAINADTNQDLWRLNFGAKLYGNFTANKNRVYATETDFGLHALDAATSKELWTNRDLPNVAKVEILEDSILVFGEGGNLMLLDAATGAARWTIRRHGSYEFIGATAERIFAYYDNGDAKTLFALDLRSGATQWNSKLDSFDTIRGKLDDDRIYVTFLNDPDIIALDAQTGKEIWRNTTAAAAAAEQQAPALESPAISGNRLYCGANDGALRVFDRTSGKLVAQKKFAADSLPSPLIVGNTGYALDLNKIHAFNLTDLKKLWTFNARGTINDLTVSSAKNVLYFESKDKSFNAVDLKKIESSARAKRRQFGAIAPDKNALQARIPIMTMGSGRQPDARQNGLRSNFAFAGDTAFYTVTNQSAANGFLMRLDLRTGKIAKIFECAAENLSTPKISENIAVFYNNKFDGASPRTANAMIAVDLQTGELLWRTASDTEFVSEPAIFNRTVYAAGKNDFLYAFDLNGSEIWRLAADIYEYDREIVAADETAFYLRRNAQTVGALNQDADRVLWNFAKNNQWISTFPALAENLIAVGIANDALYILDKQTGAETRRVEFADEKFEAMTAAGNRAFAVTSSNSYNGWLQAVDLDSGKILWQRNSTWLKPALHLYKNRICVDRYDGFRCFDQASGARTNFFPNINTDSSALDFAPNGTLLLYEKDAATDKPLNLIGIDIETNRVLWKTAFQLLTP